MLGSGEMDSRAGTGLGLSIPAIITGGTPNNTGTDSDNGMPSNRHEKNAGSYVSNYLVEGSHVKYVKVPQISACSTNNAAAPNNNEGVNGAAASSNLNGKLLTFSAI